MGFGPNRWVQMVLGFQQKKIQKIPEISLNGATSNYII
jgi:hypothetical protein